MNTTETLATLNALFTGHLSRNAANIRLAMDQHGITETTLNDLISADLIRVLNFSGQVHYERQAFGEREINRLLSTIKTTTN